MSGYNNYDYDNMIYELGEFLRDHPVSELLKLVTEVIKENERKDE